MMNLKPLDPFVAPVTAEELAEFIGLASPTAGETAMLEGFIAVAAGQVVKFCNREFVARRYSLTTDKLAFGQNHYGLAPVVPEWDGKTMLPMSPVVSVDRVVGIELDKTETDLDEYEDYYEALDVDPSYVMLYRIGGYERMRFEFTAGYADLYEVPPEMLLAVKMCAAKLYEYRGACDAGNIFKTCGAMSILSTCRVRYGL